MDSTKDKTDVDTSVLFKKIEGRWVPVIGNGCNENNRPTYTISTRQRYLSSGGKKVYLILNILYALTNKL